MKHTLKRSEMQRIGQKSRRLTQMSLAVLRIYNRTLNPKTEKQTLLGAIDEPMRCTRSQYSGFRKNNSKAMTRLNSQRLRAILVAAYRSIDEMAKIKFATDKEGKKVG